jgi:hypothetical protein
MKSFIMSCLVLAACGGTFAQNVSEPATTAVGHVYVSTNVGISGWAVNSNGTLTLVAGSPFKGLVNGMAATGNALIALGSDGVHIKSYKIGSTGALTLVSSINALTFTNSTCGKVAPTVAPLDRTGSIFYPQISDYNCASDEFRFQFFQVNKTTDQLNYSGVSSQNSMPYVDLAFAGTNLLAFGANSSTVDEFMLDSNGDLITPDISFPIPSAPSPGDFYSPSWVTTDAIGDAFVALRPVSITTHNPTGPAQIGVYTVDSSDIPTTNSTATNMLKLSVGTVNDMEVDPSGSLMCVAGTGGSQIVSLHGSGPVTPFTKLTSEPTNQCRWDLHGHLLGLSVPKQHLRVFTAGPTGFTQAAGSPHIVIGLPRGLAITK